MPGVPSGRGCDACRKQKKKCSQNIPVCSRCHRLGLQCVGSGQKRFVFRNQSKLFDTSSEELIGKSTTTHHQLLFPQSILRIPSSESEIIAYSFIGSIDTSIDIRFNLAEPHRGLMQDIPRRLGGNKALDASIDALVSAHSLFCRYSPMDGNVWKKYSFALKCLRTSLDDHTQACIPEILASVFILIKCQSFISWDYTRMIGHIRGAAQILKVRGLQQRDEFESKILSVLRAPLIMHEIFSGDIPFSAEEWESLVENHFEGNSPEMKVMSCFAKVPNFIRRGKKMRDQGDVLDLTLLEDVRATYHDIKVVAADIQSQLEGIQFENGLGNSLLNPAFCTYARIQRCHGLALHACVVINLLLCSIDLVSNQLLRIEAANFSKELVRIVRSWKSNEQLVASSTTLSVNAAWLASPNESTRSQVRDLMAECYRDLPYEFPRGVAGVEEDLKRISRRLNLLGLEPVS